MVSLELDHGLGSTTVLSRAWAMCPIVFLELDLIVRLTYKAIWEQPLWQAQKLQQQPRFPVRFVFDLYLHEPGVRHVVLYRFVQIYFS